MNERLSFYKVSEGYAGYLRDNFDNRVPNIKSADYKHDKFFVGVVFKIGELNYFAPVSSYKQQNKTTFNIKRKEEIISSIRLGYMFPVVAGVYELLPIEKFERKYQDYIWEELEYCNQNRSEIYDMAVKIYRKRTIGRYRNEREKEIFEIVTCDFKKLELGAKIYKKS